MLVWSPEILEIVFGAYWLRHPILWHCGLYPRSSLVEISSYLRGFVNFRSLEGESFCQVLYERGRISEKTQTIISYNLSSAYRDALRAGIEFWDSSKTLKYLSESEYFVDEADREKGLQWPQALKVVLSDGVYTHRYARSFL